MSKRYSKILNTFNFTSKEPGFSVTTLVTTFLFSFFIVIATFSQIPIKYPKSLIDFIINLPNIINYNIPIGKYLFTYNYIPQIPVVLLTGAVLGRKFGTLAVIFYILGGFFFPIFALGGGISYVTQYSFGFIIGYIPCVLVVGNILRRGFTLRNIIKATIMGVGIIHIFGIFYMLIALLIHHDPLYMAGSWITVLSGKKIIIDLLIGFCTLIISRYVKHFFYLGIR